VFLGLPLLFWPQRICVYVKAWDHLRVGGVFCVNTKNLRVGRQTVPLADDFLALALACGFRHETTLTLPLGRLGKVAQTEPVFILRR